jgi:hypothetical protein
VKHGITFAVANTLALLSLAADAPLDVGSRAQVFIDHRFIAHGENVELHMNQAQKLGLIQLDTGEQLYGHVSRVIEDQGKIRLYVGADGISAYESDDGIRFTRTNILIGKGSGTTIFLDEHDPDPARRYKVFWMEFAMPFDPEKHGVYGAYSSDGVNFTDVGRVLPFFVDNPCLGKYVIYTRSYEPDSENERRICRIETDDPLKPWPYKESQRDVMWLVPERVDVVLQADAEDNPYSDMYYSSATYYPWAQDVYLMFPAMFRHFSPDRNPYIRPRQPGTWEDFGLLEVQLAVSRDGIHWERPNREPYFPTGLADEWDRWYAVMAPGIVKRGNYLYQYYVSSGRTHDSVILRPEYDNLVEGPGGIGVVRQRLDGFMSADVDHRGGWLETPALIFTGNRLRLNIDTGSMGTAFVELRDAEGKPIEGYTLDSCVEIGGNFIDQTVYWNGNADVSPLAGKSIRIHFNLTRTKLYSFVFTDQ